MKKKVSLRRMVTQDNFCFLYVQSGFKTYPRPGVNRSLRIIPKADKSEYNGTKQAMKTWQVNEGNQTDPLTTLLISPISETATWELSENVIERKQLGADLATSLETWTQAHLNSEQLTALNAAKKSSISFVHGPPGKSNKFNENAF